MEKFYLTTAIAYASSTPHIGNVYEAILSDAIVRYKKKEGYDVYFQTGTDEHGQKIQEKALAKGVTPKQFVDDVTNTIKGIYASVNMQYDNFIRTTDEYHEKQVQKIFEKLYNQGDIYKGEYEGLYCVACESFFTESQTEEGNCPDCGKKLIKAKEEAYFLKLSKYQERLVKHIKDNPDFIQPESRKNEMVNNFLSEKLPDLCISRTSFDWGIPVSFDPKHVVYVWIDALSNYITGLGYDVDGNHGENFKKYWPADVHMIGKDILRFHTIYWIIMLMALGIELPKKIFGHPWILFGDGNKMSKSVGNTIYTADLIKYFGVDSTRYYVLHEIPFAQDGLVTYELVAERTNSDLANNLGNLLNRTIAMVNKYFGGKIFNTQVNEPIDDDLRNMALLAPKNVKKYMDQLRVADAIEEVFKLLRRANKYVDETEPWNLGKDESKYSRLNTVLYNLIETLRFSAVLLEPFMPDTANKMYQQLNTKVTTFASLTTFGGYESDHVNEAQPIFARIDIKELIKEIEHAKQPKVEEDLIFIEDFAKIKLVVGEVLECKKHPDAEKLLISKIDTKDRIRQIVSGIADFYTPEKMVGKKVIVVANLKPVSIRGVLSEGMILAGGDKKELEVLEVQNLKAGNTIK